MNPSSSPITRLALGLACSLAVLAPELASAQPKIEVAKDLPAKERERLQLGVDAMTKDRPKKDYAAAKKKLGKALELCKADKCSSADQAQIEFFLGIVQAEGGDEKAAQASFESALKVNGTLDPSGGLSSPPTDRAFTAAKAALSPAPTAAPPPADAGFSQPSATSSGDQAIGTVGGASFQPGLGFVLGDATASTVKTDGVPTNIRVPKLDQSSAWDNLYLRYNVGLSYTSYKFESLTAGQKKTGGLMLDLRFGAGLPLWGFLIPSIDVGVSGGKVGDNPKLLLFSGGDYEMWALNTDARAGLDLAPWDWLQIGGFAGGYFNLLAPSLENLPGEPSDSGSGKGPLYGARARLGHDFFVELSYAWRVGEHATGRYRRIEVGGLDDDGSGWSFFWEAREQPKQTAGGMASQDERLLGTMPLNYSLGFTLRNY